MKCPQCGAQVDGDFCPYCGAANETTATQNEEAPKTTPTNASNTKAEKPKKPIYKKWWFWVLVVIVVLNIKGRLGGNNSSNDAAEFVWSDMVLSEMLPEPESNYGDLSINSDDYLSIDVLKTSKDEYRAYIKACRNGGFTVDVEEYGTTFTAKNEQGYELTLYYFESDEEMSIDLTAPSENSEQEQNASTNDEEKTEDTATSSTLIDKFVTNFNKLSDTPITEREPFNPTDRDSGFYRTEYRLGAWEGSVGEIGKIGEHRVEITNYGSHGGFYDSNDDLRIYVTTSTVEEILAIFPLVAKAMDSTVTDEEIQEVIDYVNEWGDKNGLYIGELSGTIFSHQNYAQLMLDIS